jgi:hypothetical protein
VPGNGSAATPPPRPGPSQPVETVFLRRYYVSFFIEHASRRVRLAGCTTNPDGSWVTQQAPNLSFNGLLEPIAS